MKLAVIGDGFSAAAATAQAPCELRKANEQNQPAHEHDWIERNCPNILSSIAVIISLAATAFGRAFRSFEGPWNEPILESYPALFQFLAQTWRHFSRKTDEHMRILTRFPGELLHFASETGCA